MASYLYDGQTKEILAFTETKDEQEAVEVSVLSQLPASSASFSASVQAGPVSFIR